MNAIVSIAIAVFSTAQAASVTVNDPACAQFSATTGPSAALVINCQGTPPPPVCPPPQTGTPPNCVTPPGDFANCTSQGYGILGPVNVPFAGPAQGGTGSFGDHGAWVFQLTVPAGTANTGQNGSILIAENGGNAFSRHGVLSTVPCDFNRPVDYTGASGPIGACRNSSTCSINFKVAPPAFTGVPSIRAGLTYYISFRNWTDLPFPGGPSCGSGSCPTVYQYSPTH